MASPPREPPKHSTHSTHSTSDDDEPKAAANQGARGESKAPEAKAAAPKQQYPTLTKENAWALFSNGHRIAKQGDDKWISMSRAPDGVQIVTSPMTPAVEEAVRSGEYYLVEDQGSYSVPGPTTPAAAESPTNVDVPYVSASGAVASCTMGNWTGEPTSYAYAWQRDGSPISGATSSDYTMVTADHGKAIGCVVSATNAAGTTVAPVSNTVVGP